MKANESYFEYLKKTHATNTAPFIMLGTNPELEWIRFTTALSAQDVAREKIGYKADLLSRTCVKSVFIDRLDMLGATFRSRIMRPLLAAYLSA